MSYCARKKEEKTYRASSWQIRQKKSFNFIETKSISLSLLRITSPKQKEEKTIPVAFVAWTNLIHF